MTDNEIIQAMGCCAELKCHECPYEPKDWKQGSFGCMCEIQGIALDLINRKDAKIEGLKSDYTRVCAERDARIVTQSFTKSEAYREFAEKLKEKTRKDIELYGSCTGYGTIENIDNLLNELTRNHETCTESNELTILRSEDMKIPKYVQNLIDRRYKLASQLAEVCWELDEWLDKNNIVCESCDTHTGVEIYCNPYSSKRRIMEAIINSQ